MRRGNNQGVCVSSWAQGKRDIPWEGWWQECGQEDWGQGGGGKDSSWEAPPYPPHPHPGCSPSSFSNVGRSLASFE